MWILIVSDLFSSPQQVDISCPPWLCSTQPWPKRDPDRSIPFFRYSIALTSMSLSAYSFIFLLWRHSRAISSSDGGIVGHIFRQIERPDPPTSPALPNTTWWLCGRRHSASTPTCPHPTRQRPVCRVFYTVCQEFRC